jgi:hypothetical protein
MMPAPGTFMYWFLNDRSIHLYITLVRYPLRLTSRMLC